MQIFQGAPMPAHLDVEVSRQLPNALRPASEGGRVDLFRVYRGHDRWGTTGALGRVGGINPQEGQGTQQQTGTGGTVGNSHLACCLLCVPACVWCCFNFLVFDVLSTAVDLTQYLCLRVTAFAEEEVAARAFKCSKKY